MLGTLGTYRWFVFALEKDEADRSEEEWPKTTFRGFNHVGGELEAPVVALSITDKLTLSWAKVPKAEGFEIDYLSPSGSGQKNNRFKVKKSPVAFSLKNLREGTTTLTIKAQAKGYLDSNKSIVKVGRSGEKVELEEITQGKGQEVISIDPALVHWKTQYYLSILAGNYLYDSQNVSTDTSLSQKKLTSLGINLDLHLKPRLNSFLHKLNFSLLNLSSGVDSGQLTHASYTLNAAKSFQRGRFHYGLGLGYLGLPSFMGDRLTDKIEVETTAGLGPEAEIGVLYALAATWQLDFALQYLFQAHFISSDRKEPSSFGYTRAAVNVLNYITKNEALFVMVDYRAWEQQWSKDKSSINGISFGLGLKGHFK